MRKKAFVGLFLTVAFLTLLLLSGCGAAKPEENTDNKVITMLTAATPSDSFYYGFQKSLMILMQRMSMASRSSVILFPLRILKPNFLL